MTVGGLLVVAAGAVVPSVSRAAGRGLEIAPYVGFRSAESLDAGSTGNARAEADPAVSWGLSVGWWVRPDGWFEVLFDRQTLDFEAASTGGSQRFDLTVDYLQFGAGYEPERQGLRPYVTVGLGLGRFGSDPGSVSAATGLSGSIGGGFKAPLGRKVLFRLEARGWGTLTDGSAEVVCGPGCLFVFRGSGWWQLGLRAAVAFSTTGTR